LNFFGDSVYLT